MNPTSERIYEENALVRCAWCKGSDIYVRYHDHEWGQPQHDPQRLFEKLCLEGFQAGLSWLTVLRKRNNFRTAFAHFDPEIVAGFGDRDIERLLADEGIIRHRAKIEATIANARAVLTMQHNDESLAELLWSFAPRERMPEPPDPPIAQSTESEAMSRALKQRGLRFVGPTTCYSLMQACGLVNDHELRCQFR